MDSLKKYFKYILFIIGGYFLTNFLIFWGFNASYHKIELNQELPEQIVVEKAEATRSEGRVYGKVFNSAENNLNGKYIKILVFNPDNAIIATEFLKIENLGSNEQKMFRANFTADNAKSCSVSFVETDK